MQNIDLENLDSVAGGWDVTVDLGPVQFNFSGEEAAAAYDWSVNQMSDFFTWWDPAGYYSGC